MEGIVGIEDGIEGTDGIDAPPPPPPELPEGMLELLAPPELPPPDGMLELLPPLEPPEEPLEPPEEPLLPPDELGGVDEGMLGEDICWSAQPPIRKLETAPIAATSLATTSSRLMEWLLFIASLLVTHSPKPNSA